MLGMACAVLPLSKAAQSAGAKTGRSPKDKRIVKEGASEEDIWWNKVCLTLCGADRSC